MSFDGNGLVGQTLADRYTIVSRIGSGGMSTVYEALDTQLGRSVAIKLFNVGEARNDARRRSEVDVLAKLNHPNLVTMYDAHLTEGDSAEPSFLVMELVAGPDLRSTLDHGPLRGTIAGQLTTDIAEALAAMHAQGIVHRDLKPANILLAPTGLPSPRYRGKLADFGIAHLIGSERMTTAGTIVGTAAYLSPEQAQGQPPGPEADVYALGLVILEGLSGHREYPGTVVEAMSARASRDPYVSADIPASWASLLTHMTARDPAARPSAHDVAALARQIAPDLAEWDGGVATDADDRADAATAPMAPPTLRMPTTSTPGTPATGTSATEQNPHRARPWVVMLAVAVALAGIVWLATALVPQMLTSDQSPPIPATSESATPTNPSTDGGDSPSDEPASTPTSTPVEIGPSETAEPATTPPSTSPTPTAPASVTPGNNGNGNGNNGNGGKGNGNGKSKG